MPNLLVKNPLIDPSLENTYMLALGKVLNYLSYGLKTEYEISKRLDKYLNKPSLTEQQKNDLKAQITLRLQELDLINDDKVLQDIISRALSSTKPKNKKSITAFLLKRGFSSHDISIALSNFSLEYEYASAKQVFEKKLKYSKDINKIKRYLLSKGYSFEIVTRLLDDDKE